MRVGKSLSPLAVTFASRLTFTFVFSRSALAILEQAPSWSTSPFAHPMQSGFRVAAAHWKSKKKIKADNKMCIMSRKVDSFAEGDCIRDAHSNAENSTALDWHLSFIYLSLFIFALIGVTLWVHFELTLLLLTGTRKAPVGKHWNRILSRAKSVQLIIKKSFPMPDVFDLSANCGRPSGRLEPLKILSMFSVSARPASN